MQLARASSSMPAKASSSSTSRGACASEQQRDGLKQARYRREGARTQQLCLRAVPAVGHEPARESCPALAPCHEPCVDSLCIHVGIARSRIARIALGSDLQQEPLKGLQIDQELGDLARARNQVADEALKIVDQARLEAHHGG